ncbi:MAG: hypothetical protein WDZ93_03210 [Candidatus Paceibacterota bacterium]
MRSILRKTLGVLCILAGMLLGFIPLLPGIVLVLLGVHLLGLSFLSRERVEDLIARFRRKKTDDTD